MAIKIENCVLKHKGKQVPLISGEFHYWRVNKDQWAAVLDSIVEMGLKVVSTYIPWNYHELSPGKYDFTGKTQQQRDLAGFIDLTRQRGLYLVVRPGPYIYSEWQFGGVPERAAKLHRLDPEFLKMSRHYIEAVCKVLVPQQITRSGNILLCQADNEPYPPIESFGDEMGCFKDKGTFKDWLRQRYGDDLAALNRAWHESFTSFDQPAVHFHEPYVNTRLPMAQRLLTSREYYMRYADTMTFVGWYGTKIVSTVASWLRGAGIDVPIFANGWSPLYQDFTGLSEVADLVGCDVYPMPYVEGGSQTEDDWLYVMDIIKTTQSDVKNGNTWSAEFQSGCYPITLAGYLPPQHFKYLTLAQMARGLKAWNWYMLVNRDNWCHCPINEWGRTNEYFPVHKEIVRVANAVEPWKLTEATDASLFMYKPHRVITPGNFEEMFYALEKADVSYNYWDPQAAQRPDNNTLIYAGGDWLERAVADRLADFVEGGGTLICFNQFPTCDEQGQPLERLKFDAPKGARPVILPVAVKYKGGATAITRGGHMGCKVNFFWYPQVQGEPIVLAINTKAKELLVDLGAVAARSFSIGYSRKLGRGRIVLVGSNPSAELIKLVLEQEGGISANSGEKDVLTNVHRAADGSWVLFVTNRAAHDRKAAVSLNLAKLGLSAKATYKLDALTRECGCVRKGAELASFEVPVNAHDVTIIRITRS